MNSINADLDYIFSHIHLEIRLNTAPWKYLDSQNLGLIHNVQL